MDGWCEGDVQRRECPADLGAVQTFAPRCRSVCCRNLGDVYMKAGFKSVSQSTSMMVWKIPCEGLSWSKCLQRINNNTRTCALIHKLQIWCTYICPADFRQPWGSEKKKKDPESSLSRVFICPHISNSTAGSSTGCYRLKKSCCWF